ncbi:MAG: c-type cytochrome [Chitinophagales bacterium]
MRKISIAIFLFVTVLIFQFCTSSKKTTSAKPAAITYESGIKPVIETNCTPCHIAGKGNKKPLDNYAGATSSADDIIARIQKTPGDHGFMPAMHPKLSDSTINLFVQWKNTSLLEK